MTRRHHVTHSLWLLASTALITGYALMAPTTGFAACTTTADTTSCVGPVTQTTTVGSGRPSNDKTVIVEGDATIDVGQANAISLGNNANITLKSGALVTNVANREGGNYGTGFNTIEFNSNGTLVIEEGASVIKTGKTLNGEAVNVHGFGNTIINHGLIQAANSAAIWFEDQVTGTKNVVDNYGTIERVGGVGNVLGTSGTSGIVFYNRTGAEVIGDLKFAAGNDDLIFEGGSLVTGSINGGGGTNNLTLQGDIGSDDVLRGDIVNFSTLTKDGAGRWTVDSSLNGFAYTDIRNGTLVLTGDNSNYAGDVIVESNGTLEASAQSMPTVRTTANNLSNILNSGLVRFAQSEDGSYIGQIIGNGAVEKTGAGVLVLAPVAADGNLYSGGTTIKQGVLAVSADNQLGIASGALTLDGGTLRFDNAFDLSVARAIIVAEGNGSIDTQDFTTTLAQGTTGSGTLSKTGQGTLVLTGDNQHAGGTTIAEGIVALTETGALSGGGDVTVAAAAQLGGYGSVTGNVTNEGTLAVADALASFAGGTAGNFTVNGNLANNGAINMGGATVGNKLIVNGDYTGNGGTISLNTTLGDDASATDQLRVNGNTAGSTLLAVTNRDGLGARTNEGIEIVSITGASNGEFALIGDYQVDGETTLVAGAYAYQLYKGNASGSDSKGWYLRSELKDKPAVPDEPAPEPGDNDNSVNVPGLIPEPEDKPAVKPAPDLTPEDNYAQVQVPATPRYQAGVPAYEAYPQALLGLNGLPTLQQRVGNRFWAGQGNRVIAEGADAITPYASAEEAGTYADGNGVWGRIEGQYDHIAPSYSTSGTDYNQSIFKLQSGIDGQLAETDKGTLIGGIYVQYVHGKTKVYSASGDGEISTDGYGVGGTLTWYGNDGFYVDGQAQLAWYNSDLNSALAGRDLINGNNGLGYAFSIEAGKRIALNEHWSITPQAQLSYSNVDFDSFTDPFGARVSRDKGDSLRGRVGVTLDREKSWKDKNGRTSRAHVYGIANLYNEFGDGSQVDVSGVKVKSKKERVWAGVGVGGSLNWHNDKYSIYGEGTVNTSLNNFGESTSVKANVGFRIKF